MKRYRLLLFSVLIVVLLVSGCGLWVWQAKRQYGLDRQLIDALLRNDTKMAIVLVNQGADPNTRQEPPLAPSLKLLLNHLLHHKPPVNDSPTAFIIACGPRLFLNSSGNTTWGRQPHYPNEDVGLVQTMLQHGADVKARYMQEYTALFGAMNDDRLPTVKLLLQYGTNSNALDKHGETPLMLAVEEEKLPLMRLLLSYGANPNLQDVEGNTVLHMAVLSPVPQSVIPDLLVYQADINLPNKDGETPLMLAQKIHRADLVALMRKGAK